MDELHDLDDSDERGLGTSDDEDDLEPEPEPAALPDLPQNGVTRMMGELSSLAPDELQQVMRHLTRREATGARASCRQLRDACRALEDDASSIRLHHNARLFVGNSVTCEVVELFIRGLGPPVRVAEGKAWAMSSTKKKPTDGWLTGIAHHRGLLYCLQYAHSCIVVLDAENGLRYKRKYDLPFQHPEGIASGGGYVYVSFEVSQIVRSPMTAEGGIDVTSANLSNSTPQPAFGLKPPCYLDDHSPISTHMIWGATLGPDGALYVCAEREYYPLGANYTIPPTPCEKCTSEGKGGDTGTILRVAWNDGNDADRVVVPATLFGDALALHRPSAVAFMPCSGDALVASMDGMVRAFRRQNNKYVHEIFYDATARDTAGREACDNPDLSPLQPVHVFAPPNQGGVVFITLHRGLDYGDYGDGENQFGASDAGIVACDASGNELWFFQDEKLTAHGNVIAGE